MMFLHRLQYRENASQYCPSPRAGWINLSPCVQGASSRSEPGFKDGCQGTGSGANAIPVLFAMNPKMQISLYTIRKLFRPRIPYTNVKTPKYWSAD